ncbi:MAG: hypothetical protein R3F19_00650 [Verrucomicrobiales bacterium]
MKQVAFITIWIILFTVFVGSAFMQWRWDGIIRKDVEYLTERIINAPGEMPWQRMEGSYPSGIHEEIDFHRKIMSVFSTVNHVSALLLIMLLTVTQFRAAAKE